MKKMLLLLVSMLVITFIISTVLSIGFLSGLDRFWVPRISNQIQAKTVSVILPFGVDIFWDDLTQKLEKLGLSHKLSYDFSRYSPNGINTKELIERSIYSQVDALICLPPDISDFSDVVNLAEARGVPVILLENDLPNSKRQIFMGTGSFQIGQAIGKIICTKLTGPKNVGILLSQSSLENQTIRNSLLLNGLNEELHKQSLEYYLTEEISPLGRFTGEELVSGLLHINPPLNFLVTTNPKDTAGALQTITDLNRVGRIFLIGMGEDLNLQDSLKKGLLEGLVTRDSSEWALLIDGALMDLFEGGAVSSYINLPVHFQKGKGK